VSLLQRRHPRKAVNQPHEKSLAPSSEDLTLAQELGTAIHTLIALVASKHGGEAQAEQVWEAARSLGSGRLAPVYRQSARQRVATAAATYFREFSRAGWRFEGAERIVEGVALDLLWSRRTNLEADELKSGLGAPAISLDAVHRQVEVQVTAAAAAFGPSFRGVRAVLLAGRPQSFFIATTTTGGRR
jgi:hypothetical protein